MSSFLETSYLAAALNCVSTDKTRFYLNGVCVTYNASQSLIYYEATDGHVAFAARRVWDGGSGPAFQLIIPTDAIKLALKAAGKFDSIELVDIGDGKYRLGAITFEPTDGTFPDMSRVTPKEITGELAVYHPAKLLMCQKALMGTGKHTGAARIGYCGNGPAVMTGTLEDAYCLIMSLREERLESVPAWAGDCRTSERPANAA